MEHGGQCSPFWTQRLTHTNGPADSTRLTSDRRTLPSNVADIHGLSIELSLRHRHAATNAKPPPPLNRASTSSHFLTTAKLYATSRLHTHQLHYHIYVRTPSAHPAIPATATAIPTATVFFSTSRSAREPAYPSQQRAEQQQEKQRPHRRRRTARRAQVRQTSEIAAAEEVRGGDGGGGEWVGNAGRQWVCLWLW